MAKDTATVEVETKRPRKTSIKFIDASGNEASRPSGETVATIFHDLATGAERRFEPSAYPAVSVNALVHFGWKERLSNSFAKGWDSVEATDDNLRAGVWAEAGGESVSILSIAVFRVRSAAGQTTLSDGSPLTEESLGKRIAAIRNQAEAGDEKAKTAIKGWESDPKVKAEMESIKLDRQKERAALAKKAAKETAAETDFADL